MKQIFTLCFLLFSISLFAQSKSASEKAVKESPAVISTPNNADQVETMKRTSSTSNQTQTAAPVPLPYNVDDKYMGRKAEFLNNLTVSELPSDFPAYEKQWGVKEYNSVVTSFYLNHKSIVKETLLEKLKHTYPNN